MTPPGSGAAAPPTDTIKKYWADMIAAGELTPSRPGTRWRQPAPRPASWSGARQVPATEDRASAELRQELATAQQARSEAVAAAAALQAQITRLEAQLRAQGQAAQAAVRAARGDWIGSGFVGGYLVTIGVICGFLIYFTSL